MIRLLKLASEIRNSYNISNEYKINFVLKKLESLEDYVDILEAKKSTIRFQDYIDFNKGYIDNLNYFEEYHTNDDDLLCFNIYYLKKELCDLFELIKCGDFQIEDINYLYDSNFFDDINIIIEFINQDFCKDNNKNSLAVDNNLIRNLIIFSNNLDDIIQLSLDSKSGLGELSIKKSMNSLTTLKYTRYNEPQFSKYLHKIKVNSSKDFRLTNYNILGERYSSGRTTKIAFFKLPIIASNLEMLKNKLGIPNLEYIYYVPGFGNFKDIGMDEHTLYDHFIRLASQSEQYFQELVNLVSMPFNEERLDDIVNIINESNRIYQENFNLSNVRKK